MRTLSTPNLTPAQVAGVVAAGLRLLVAFGIDLSDEQVAAVNDFVTAVLVIVGADAVVRLGRAIGTGGSVPK